MSLIRIGAWLWVASAAALNIKSLFAVVPDSHAKVAEATAVALLMFYLDDHWSKK